MIGNEPSLWVDEQYLVQGSLYAGAYCLGDNRGEWLRSPTGWGCFTNGGNMDGRGDGITANIHQRGCGPYEVNNSDGWGNGHKTI
jgi:hypothetical protein